MTDASVPTLGNGGRRGGRRLLPALLLLALVAPAGALDVGQPAPAFEAPRLDGKGTLSLEQYRGKVVYLDFWASWCAPCLVALPELESMRQELPADRFQVLAVNLDKSPDRARRFLQKLGVGYPSASDPEGGIPERFGVKTMPTSFLIDGAGRVRHVHAGFRKGDADDLEKRIRALLTESGQRS